jgi:hypothetical protein
MLPNPLSKPRLIIALFDHYMHYAPESNSKDRAWNYIMPKKKVAEAQIQQEQTSASSVASIETAGWIPGTEPMTGTQAASLKRLAEELREPQAFDAGLNRREASRRIYGLQERLRLGQLPPHTD